PIKPRAKYRYNVEGYSIGGPVYIPGHFNTEKKRLFFFFSQEYTGQYTPPSNVTNSAVSGTPVVLLDPSTGSPFPNNCIPASRIDPQGQAMAAFFPKPNFTPAPGSP